MTSLAPFLGASFLFLLVVLRPRSSLAFAAYALAPAAACPKEVLKA